MLRLANNKLSGGLGVLKTLVKTSRNPEKLQIDARYNMFEGVVTKDLQPPPATRWQFYPQGMECAVGYDRKRDPGYDRQKPGNESNLDFGTCAPFKCDHGEQRGTTACELCLPGFSSKMPSNKEQKEPIDCTPCSAGQFAGEKGMTACSKCPAGLYQEDMGSTVCSKCKVGLYAGIGQPTCNYCPQTVNPDTNETLPKSAWGTNNLHEQLENALHTSKFGCLCEEAWWAPNPDVPWPI